MLKDKLKKIFDSCSKKEKDPLKLNIADGFVDIKGYKVSDDGSKKLIYHDCGDNVVTDWMRHAILMMLAGITHTNQGKSDQFLNSTESRNYADSITSINKDNHSDKLTNFDGYLLNGCQYFWNPDDLNNHFSKSTFNSYTYSIFPTKVLFGTGKEYSSWEELQAENEVSNASWYADMLARYGDGDVFAAKNNFNENIEKIECNTFSGSIAKNVHTGNSDLIRTRTVNSPDASSKIMASAPTMNKDYGVVGAIKTPYFSKNDQGYLHDTTTDSGKTLKPSYNGIGRPCFIYFNTTKDDPNGWISPASDISLSRDNECPYLNKITFKINMPSQSASNGSPGAYYPYNGYSLKQMGLYNDSKMVVDPNNLFQIDSISQYPISNMPAGMLLAKKNITTIDKTSDVELIMTWTLTI